jgi:CheY-like chemotaxis protein/HPt (histidine-containing phosphotransfer) domain-containing protein
MMALLISEKGYNYDTASNGIEAIEAIKTQSYDIVLMDLQMPIMDGFEATTKIRSLEAGNQHTPIVALTAMLFADEIQRCLSVGMDDCISKPFNTESLFQLIESYVSQSKPPVLKKENQGTTSHDKQTILDVQEALPRFSKDVEFYRDFLNEFIDGLPQRIEQFRAIFLSGDYKALSDKAHNLKGISASMGAKQLSHLSQKLDQISQDGNPLVIQAALEEIEKHTLLFQQEALSILSGFTGQPEN